MPVTFTANAAQSGVQAKGGHIGVQTEVFAFNGTASISAGDVVLACKLPNYATVLDCAIRLFLKDDTQATVNAFVAKKDDGSASAIFTMGSQLLSSTGGAVMFRPTGTFAGPTKISISDDAMPQFVYLKLGIAAGTSTTSFSCNGYITFAMDEF